MSEGFWDEWARRNPSLRIEIDWAGDTEDDHSEPMVFTVTVSDAPELDDLWPQFNSRLDMQQMARALVEMLTRVFMEQPEVPDDPGGA